MVFRVPVMLNKIDIQTYLEGVYAGLRVREVVTFNFLSKTTCQGRRTKPAYKSAIVTLERGPSFCTSIRLTISVMRTEASL